MLLATAILLELFTSEGCSSCPPADALLARLSQSQPVAGVTLVVLSEHVDYWNDLGWKDPFSSARFSERQTRYGRRAYTPQAVVDGREDMVGSDEGAIRSAAQAAGAKPHGLVQLSPAADGRSVRVAVSSLPSHGPAHVYLASVEDGLESRVERGENAGRTLRHFAVVRELRDIGVVAAGAESWSAEAPLSSGTAKKLRTIAFVQETAGGRVLATAAP